MSEVMVVSMIMHNMIVEQKRVDSVYDQGAIFRVIWLLQTLNRHPFKSFSMQITTFETGQPTMSSMKIW
jgi:hypothetical protein